MANHLHVDNFETLLAMAVGMSTRGFILERVFVIKDLVEEGSYFYN